MNVLGKSLRQFVVAATVFAGLVGCNSIDDKVMQGTDSQLETRQFQTRTLADIEKAPAMRAIIATLQDLGFVIDKADLVLGSVTATKLQTYSIVMTVTVRSRGTGTLVRANANYNKKPIDDPEPYQDFFVSLDKAVFLQRHRVD